MTTHVLLNVLHLLGERFDARLCRACYRFPRNEFDKLNNTGAGMHDSIDHRSLQSHFFRNFRI